MAACRRSLLLLLWGQLLLVLLLAAMQATPASASRPLAPISWQPSPPQPDCAPEVCSKDPRATSCDTTHNSPCHEHPSEPAVAAAAAPLQRAWVREEVSTHLWAHSQAARQLLQATTPEAPPVPVGSMAAPPAQQQDDSCLVSITYGVTDGRASGGGGGRGHGGEVSVFGAFTIEPAVRPKQVGAVQESLSDTRHAVVHPEEACTALRHLVCTLLLVDCHEPTSPQPTQRCGEVHCMRIAVHMVEPPVP
jgi:hypothetical protein